jgi:hypothetical protein
MKFYHYHFVVYAPADYDDGYSYRSSNIPNIGIWCREYCLERETQKGYWIVNAEGSVYHRKWVSKTARKRYAYPSRREAMDSFVARTKCRISILNRQAKECEYALLAAERENVDAQNP